MTDNKTSSQTTFTIRLPGDIMGAIENQVKQTKQSKTAVTIAMLQNAIPSLHITERSKLPALPGVYFVYTPDHQLLYVGKADNLKIRWNSHHKYQYFIETSMQCRIGYFVTGSVEDLGLIIEEFKDEPIDTTTSALVTLHQLEAVKDEVKFLTQRIDSIYSALSQLGLDAIVKKLSAYQPPRGRQNWSPNQEDTREGITRGNLIKKLGFDSTKAFEDAVALLELDETEYLSELSGWVEQAVEPGSSRTRFFPKAE